MLGEFLESTSICSKICSTVECGCRHKWVQNAKQEKNSPLQSTFKGVSLSRTLKKGTFSQFWLKQKIKTLVREFSHIFRHIFELVKKKISFENKKKSRTYRRSRAASHHGQLILRAWYYPKFSSETHIYLFFLFRRVFRL